MASPSDGYSGELPLGVEVEWTRPQSVCLDRVFALLMFRINTSSAQTLRANRAPTGAMCPRLYMWLFRFFGLVDE